MGTNPLVALLESLRRDVGRALIQAHFSGVGRDYAYDLKNTDRAQHLAVIAFEGLPAKLAHELSDLTGKLLGVMSGAVLQATVAHLRELPERWEATIDRSILESYVLHIAGACEWFVEEIRGPARPRAFIERFPAHAGELNEYRATRNCLLHNAGVADEDYFKKAGGLKRVQLFGDKLPLTWTYAYSRKVDVLDFAEAAIAMP